MKTIPVVLTRLITNYLINCATNYLYYCSLKQKDEEWRGQQRASARIWRDISEKNYLKALDYQSQVCKQADAKLMRPKTLVHNIEVLYDEVGYCSC